MSARYRILIPDELLGMGLQWPPGVRIAEQLDRGTAGTHWYLLEDPEAPGELEGREVRLTLARDDDGVPVITRRSLIAAHLASREDGTLQCCDLPPWEVPAGDWTTYDPQAATCAGDRELVTSQGG